MCLPGCLSIWSIHLTHLPIYRSIYLSIYLSICRPSDLTVPVSDRSTYPLHLSLSIYLIFVYLSDLCVCLPVCLGACLRACLVRDLICFIYLICLPVYLSIYLSVCLSVWFIRLSVDLPICSATVFSTYLIYLSACLFVYLIWSWQSSTAAFWPSRATGHHVLWHASLPCMCGVIQSSRGHAKSSQIYLCFYLFDQSIYLYGVSICLFLCPSVCLPGWSIICLI